jgi:hypothetical protein
VAQEEIVDHQYRIYALTKNERKDLYVAEGRGTCEGSNVPLISESVDVIAKILPEVHGMYVENHLLSDIRNEDKESRVSFLEIYLVISFKPSGEAAVYNRDFYKTRRLTEDEQSEFLEVLASETRRNISDEIKQFR